MSVTNDSDGGRAAGVEVEPGTVGVTQALDRLRTTQDGQTSLEPNIEQVSRELHLRANPERVAPSRALNIPWSAEGRARAKARDSALEARLDIFRDDLRAVRIANEVLNRAATMRAVEAAEIAIFEIRCLGETTRFGILNNTHLEMTRQFLDQLESLEAFRGRVTPELLDALKERALNEFTTRMNRASKADVEFSRADILRIKP